MVLTVAWQNPRNLSSGIPSHLVGRSSHALAILANYAYIFGGEKEPRKPIGNELLVVDLTYVHKIAYL